MEDIIQTGPWEHGEPSEEAMEWDAEVHVVDSKIPLNDRKITLACHHTAVRITQFVDGYGSKACRSLDPESLCAAHMELHAYWYFLLWLLIFRSICYRYKENIGLSC